MSTVVAIVRPTAVSLRTWMSYVRIAHAAIQRHRMEAPYRAQFRAAFPRKKCNMAFGHLLMKLHSKGLIDIKKTGDLRQRYEKLSKLIHG